MTLQPPYERVVLLTEDQGEQRVALQRAAERYFASELIHTAGSCADALAELTSFAYHSPGARLYGVLDYNMGQNLPGERRPAEALFFDPTFQRFLQNGGVVVMYSGYLEQVRQSPTIMDSPHRYPNLALLVAEKASVPTDDVLRFLESMPPSRILGLRQRAEQVGYNLGTLLEQIRRGTS